MSRLPSTIKFRDTVTRRRQGPGEYDAAGEWRPGAVTDTTFRASVQPLELEDSDTVAGSALRERWRLYIPYPGALRAASETAEADRVLIGAVEYTVVDCQTWPGSHTRATVLRET